MRRHLGPHICALLAVVCLAASIVAPPAWAGSAAPEREEAHTAMQRLAFGIILKDLADMGWDLRFPLVERQKPAVEAA